MELNQTTLRGILAAILSVDSKYIVPKQGNWWNPQDRHANIENWCAYRIKSNKPLAAPFTERTKRNNKTNDVVVLKRCEIELQFVGPQSEELAQSVAAWTLRSDVQQQFKQVQGAILYDDCNAISSYFAQDGNNTITAWNVSFAVNWYSVIDSGQGLMPATELNGKVIN